MQPRDVAVSSPKSQNIPHLTSKVILEALGIICQVRPATDPDSLVAGFNACKHVCMTGLTEWHQSLTGHVFNQQHDLCLSDAAAEILLRGNQETGRRSRTAWLPLSASFPRWRMRSSTLGRCYLNHVQLSRDFGLFLCILLYYWCAPIPVK